MKLPYRQTYCKDHGSPCPVLSFRTHGMRWIKGTEALGGNSVQEEINISIFWIKNNFYVCVCACVTCNSNWFYLQKNHIESPSNDVIHFLRQKGFKDLLVPKSVGKVVVGRVLQSLVIQPSIDLGPSKFRAKQVKQMLETDLTWPSTNPIPKHFRSEKGKDSIATWWPMLWQISNFYFPEAHP